jgi:hypothetical protein
LDCDGIEEDGDFSFTVTTNVISGAGSTVYGTRAMLGNCGRASEICRREYNVPASAGQQISGGARGE